MEDLVGLIFLHDRVGGEGGRRWSGGGLMLGEFGPLEPYFLVLGKERALVGERRWRYGRGWKLTGRRGKGDRGLNKWKGAFAGRKFDMGTTAWFKWAYKRDEKKVDAKILFIRRSGRLSSDISRALSIQLSEQDRRSI